MATDGPIFTRCTNGGRSARKTRSPGIDDVLAERVGDEIDLMTERGERADAVKLAEWGAARLEKRLGRDHQNAHATADFRTNP